MAEKKTKAKTQEVVTVKSFTAQGDQRNQTVWKQQEDGTWHADNGGRMEDKDFEKEMKHLKETRNNVKIERDKIKLEE